VEAGVSLVTVNWQDETHIDGVNTCWDTHQENFPKLKHCFVHYLTGVFSLMGPASGAPGNDARRGGRRIRRTPRMGQFSQA
jgi:hypothetical protein